MAHIILTGATGRAGAAILARALDSPAIARVTILSRRPVKLAENKEKVTVLLHNDFTKYHPDTLAKLKDADGCIWALGTSSVGMNEEDYAKITFDYTLAAATAFAKMREEGERFNFVFLSGEGANTKATGQLFARVKGRTEVALLQLGQDFPGLNIYNTRPGGIDTEGKSLRDKEGNWEDRLMYWIGPILSKVAKGWIISANTLAKACLILVVGDGMPITQSAGVEMDGRLLRCTALRRLGEGADTRNV